MKTLLTGFDRFGDVAINSSQIVVETLKNRAVSTASAELIAEVLPTEFVRAEARVRTLIRQHRPERIICLGVSSQLSSIHLERVALNLDDTHVADNAGMTRKGQLIVPDAPLAYYSTLPLDILRDRLAQRGIPVAISNHAGTYVCNHVFYVARREVDLLRLDIPCGFIHLPSLLDATLGDSRDKRGLPLEMIIDAVECCLEEVG